MLVRDGSEQMLFAASWNPNSFALGNCPQFYSRAALAPFFEADLNEFVGVNAGTTDIVINLNTAAACVASGLAGPAQGPIDWNCDGTLELHVAADIDNDNGTPDMTLYGFDDWWYLKQQLKVQPDAIELLLRRIVYEDAPRGGPFRPR